LRLKEQVLRVLSDAFGASLPDGLIVPGGVARDIARRRSAARSNFASPIEAEVRATALDLRRARRRAGSLHGGGRVAPGARAVSSGSPAWPAVPAAWQHDLRVDHPGVRRTTRSMCAWRLPQERRRAARVAVRFDETVLESMRLMPELLGSSHAGPGTPWSVPSGTGFRRWGPGGGLARRSAGGSRGSARTAWCADCHPHDPSWQNWPLLEHAVIGNIVPDFPLINKSFNLSPTAARSVGNTCS
jgi:Ni,Fe-hydrogenase III large subunit